MLLHGGEEEAHRGQQGPGEPLGLCQMGTGALREPCVTGNRHQAPEDPPETPGQAAGGLSLSVLEVVGMVETLPTARISALASSRCACVCSRAN